jgi:hypothetical protein
MVQIGDERWRFARECKVSGPRRYNYRSLACEQGAGAITHMAIAVEDDGSAAHVIEQRPLAMERLCERD